MRGLLAILGAALFLAGPALAVPAEIIFLRHAEKPPEGPELDARGRERARALVELFRSDPRVLGHGRAAAIYAAGPMHPGGSVRSIETMEPTARALDIPLHSEILRDELPRLVQAILGNPAFDGKTVIVCWEHKLIPVMVRKFGWTAGPKKWGDPVFDRLWILDFSGGRPVRFRDWPERLLPGDSSALPSTLHRG